MVTRPKYSAIKTDCGSGHRHDSRIEARRCDELTLLEKGGAISHLIQQPVFQIAFDDRPVCKVIADFQYREDDRLVTIDVKGMDTPLSRLKRKLVAAAFPGTVIEIYPPKVRKARKTKERLK